MRELIIIAIGLLVVGLLFSRTPEFTMQATKPLPPVNAPAN